jgi:hypothetical protein
LRRYDGEEGRRPGHERTVICDEEDLESPGCELEVKVVGRDIGFELAPEFLVVSEQRLRCQFSEPLPGTEGRLRSVSLGVVSDNVRRGLVEAVC